MKPPACTDLREAFPQFRITMGPDHEPGCRKDPWNYRIPGRYGWVCPDGHGQVQVYTDRPRMKSKILAASPAGSLWQAGDEETVIRLPASLALPVIRLIRPYSRRTVTPERRAAAAARFARSRRTRSTLESPQTENEA